MLNNNLSRWTSFFLLLSSLACGVIRQTPQPVEMEQLSFEIQTATPTVSLLFDAPTNTPDPNATATPTVTATLTPTQEITITLEPAEIAPTEEAPAAPPTKAAPLPAPSATAEVAIAEPLRGGDWDFEAGFSPWTNPHGDSCDGSGLALGWNAFTTRDQYGSSCMNQTVWKDNVYSGESAQEITFAFVGNKAGIFKIAPTTPGHRYTVGAFMRREFSPAKVEVSLGIDGAGGVNWEADTVQWYPWREDLDDQWAGTEETVTAAGQNMTIFIKGDHPFPEPGGALRLDSISVTDLGPE